MPVIEVFGVAGAVTMVVAYALESRATIWIAVFAVGCVATAVYAVITEAWVFVVLELVWAAIASRRFYRTRRSRSVVPLSQSRDDSSSRAPGRAS